MAEAMVASASDTAAAAPPSTGSLFQRRIEFLPAKKQFTGFSNGGGGFKLETLNPTTSDPNKQSGIGQESGRVMMSGGKRPDLVDSMELAIDPELSFRFTMKRIGAGLENLGNTCFLNSVLQCLTYTEPLAAYLQSGRHKSSCRKAGFCALCAIQNHVSRALQSTGRSLAPKDLVSNLRSISRNFRNCRQEDAHEYMVNLLESMHKCCLPSGVPSESPSAFEKSLVHKIFGGRLRSQVKCMQCSFCSDKFDPFLDLSLEINRADSLQKALANFTAKEYLDGGAREYECQKCKQKVKALKQLSIHKAPYVLNVHLKRFGCHQPGQKIDKKVHFSPTLDLKPFVTGAYDGDLRYTLYGVLVHYGGSTHSGHYYCFVRTSSGMWYSLDDHRVCNVSEKRVLEERAYMLFYVRDGINVIPKKPVNVGHTQSMIINAMGNRIQSNCNQISKNIFQNGHTDKKAGLHPSALVQVNAAVSGAIKENIAKGKSIQETVTARPSLEKEVPNNMPLIKHNAKELPNGGGSLTRSYIANKSVEGRNIAATGNEIKKCDNAKSTNEKPNSAAVESPQNNFLQDSVFKNHSNEVVKTHENNQEFEKNTKNSLAEEPLSNGSHSSSVDSRIADSISLKVCDEKESKIVTPLSLVEETSHLNKQIKDSSKETSDGDGSKKMELSLTEPSKTLSIPRKSPADKSQRKLKKKFSKSQIATTRLSSGIILGSVFSCRKKIKKKAKRSASKIKILSQENLGPSTSELTRPLPIAVDSQKKGSIPSSSKSLNISIVNNGNGSDRNLVESVADEKLRERVSRNDAVAAVNSSVGKESNDVKETRRESTQNGIMNMLTRGLEERVVQQWDEIGHPSSQIYTSSSEEPVRIGYIGDEWDEEYDRGKRKKVKNSITDFSGPNPFQVIATQKAKFKKAKLDRYSSANQPYRI